MTDAKGVCALKSSPEVLALTDPQGAHVIFLYSLQTQEPMGYVRAYDPEAYNGRGAVDFTQDQAKALRFKDAAAAWACYHLQPKCRPMRDYGDCGPNRPMTAATAQIMRYGDSAELGDLSRAVLKTVTEAKLARTPKA